MKLISNKASFAIGEGEYEVASSTALKRGQVVKLSGGKVVSAATGETGAILGVCLENHKGSFDLLDPRANGTAVKVADSPSLVFASPAPEITATAGTTTTVSASALGSFADDAFNGGYARLKSKAANSTNGGTPGALYSVSDYDGTNKKLTLGVTLSGAVSVGDVYEVFPPIGACIGALDSGALKLALGSATSSFALRVVGWDTARGLVYLMADKHLYGNKN